MLPSGSARGQVVESAVDKELARKKKELDELNELIARKRAIVAFEQKKRAPVVDPKEQTGWSPQSLPLVEEQVPKWLPVNLNQDARSPNTPIKSILKKPTQSFQEPTFPLEVCYRVTFSLLCL